MSNTTETAVDWWVTTGFFGKGGEKVMGPFVSRELAMEVRTLRETVEGHCSYFIDSEPQR
jgi:hypothetical protein